MVTVRQFTENLTGRQAAGAVRARLDWKYCLGLALEDEGFDFSVLSEFRARLVAGTLELAILDLLLGRLKELDPAWSALHGTLGRLAQLVTVGTLPPELRELLDQRWTRRQQAELDALAAAVRAGNAILPERLRYMREVARVRSGELRPGAAQ